jgi:mannosyltransferase
VAAEAEEGTPGEPAAPGERRVAPPEGPRRSAFRRLDPVLVGVTLAGLAVRAWGLGTQSLWYDEWLTQEAMDGGPGHLARHVADREGIPLPYFALLWVWTRLAGDGEVALRTVSLVAGVATIPVAYALARRIAADSRWPARAAALLVAVNPLAVWYSQEARPYALLCLAGALVVLAAVRAGAEVPPVRRDVVLLGLAAAAAVAVHYFAAFLVVAVGVALLAVRREAWRTWLLAGVPAAVVLAALAPLAARQHSHDANRDWITAFPLLDRLTDAGRSALVGPSPPADGLWAPVLVVALVGAAAGLVLAPRAERRAVALLVAVGLGSVALALAAAGVGVDAVVGRYLIAALVPLAVAFAVAAGRPPRGLVGWAGPVAVIVVAGLSVVVVGADARDDELQRPDWRSVARAFEGGDGAGPGADDGGARALVVGRYGNLAGPLRSYVEGARVLEPGETALVEEVDVVVARPSDAPCNFLVGRACSLVFLGTPPPEPLGSALGPAERQDLGQFALDRYRPERPVEVSPEVVAAGPDAVALVLVLD